MLSNSDRPSVQCAHYTKLAPFCFASVSKNRRCGELASTNATAWHKQPDYHSPICKGAAADGSLDVNEAEMQRRCSLDERCAGYCLVVKSSIGHARGRSTFDAVPLVHFTNWVYTLPGHSVHFKEDLCPIRAERDVRGASGGGEVVANDGNATVSDGQDGDPLVAAMASWSKHSWDKLRVDPRFHTKKLSHKLSAFQNFSETELPAWTRRLPVFYPFAGFDVLTARSFFPESPHFILTSCLPFGDVACFFSGGCRTAMVNAVEDVFLNWQWHDFAWSEERRLSPAIFEGSRYFPGFNATFGIAPVLLFCLAVLGLSPVAIEHRAGTNIVTISGSDGTKFTYSTRYLGVGTVQDDIVFIDELLAARRSPASSSSLPMFATFTKAAALGWTYLRDPALSMHVLGRSAAVITDETGFPPTFYDRSTWHVQGYGDLAELEKSYGDLAMKEVWAKYGKDHELYNKSQAWGADMRGFFVARPPLPFVFGYGASKRGPGARGCLLAAWRHKRHAQAGARLGPARS